MLKNEIGEKTLQSFRSYNNFKPEIGNSCNQQLQLKHFRSFSKLNGVNQSRNFREIFI